MILPKHAFEAFMQLNIMGENHTSSKHCAAEYCKQENVCLDSKTGDINAYIETLLVVTASLNGKIASDEASAIQFITGTTKQYDVATQEECDFIYRYPPSLLYDLFAYQNESKEIVLPDFLGHIKTLIHFIGQIDSPNEADSLYHNLVSFYEKALKQVAIASDRNALDQ